MKWRLVAYAVGLILRSIKPEDVKILIDAFIDRVEDHYSDNASVMGLIGLLRQSLSIPDDIGGDED